MRIDQLATVRQGMSVARRAAGAHAGDWTLEVVESADIAEDRLQADELRTLDVRRSAWSEKHLLRPFDVLVTARSRAVKVSLVPPELTRAVAAATLLVIEPHERESGLAHYLWYYLTSAQGRLEVETRVIVGSSIPSLSASALGEIEIGLPSSRDLDRIARLIEASEEAYMAALESARLRREALRNTIVHRIHSSISPKGGAAHVSTVAAEGL